MHTIEYKTFSVLSLYMYMHTFLRNSRVLCKPSFRMVFPSKGDFFPKRTVHGGI